MESTVVVKEVLQSCSSNLVAKSVESPIKIDSISIDLVNTNEDIDIGNCEHFSIRQYASEMRNKDWKRCWPFEFDGGQNVSGEQSFNKLPPLLVPKFRWWSCQNCLQEIGTEGNVNEARTDANKSSKLKSFGSCSHVSSHADAVMELSDLQQAGMLNVQSRNCDNNACFNVNISDHHPLVNDKNGKAMANIRIIEQTDHALEINSNKVNNVPNHAGIEVISSLMQQTLHIDDKVASLNIVDRTENEVAIVELPESNLKCTVKDATETCQTEKHAPTSDQHVELVKACGSNGMTTTVNRVCEANDTHTAEHSSLELDDCDYASSESAEIMCGSGSGSSYRRKTRKVRLLTELLGKNGDKKTDLMHTEGCPSSAIPDETTGIDSVPAHHGQVNFEENVTSNLDYSKKRKLPQYEEWRPGVIRSQNSEHKNLRTFNKGSETADGIASSDSEGTVKRSGSQAGAKSHLFNHKVEKSTVIGKKKNKKTQHFDEYMSLSLSRENMQKERQKKPGDTTKSNATDIVLYKTNDVSVESSLDLFPGFSHKAEKKSNLWIKRSKMHQDRVGHASPIPRNNGILGEGLALRKDIGAKQIGSIAVPLDVIQDASAEKGLQFSFSDCLHAKKYDGKYITSIRDGLPPCQGPVLSEYDNMRKNLKMNHIGETSFPPNSELDAYLWKGIRVDLNNNQPTYRIPFLNEKQDNKSHAEVGKCNMIQQMDFSGISNNGKTVELQDHSAVARKHYNQRSEIASEQGAIDDIPMEIVELMAKNQYERCLPDTEIDKRLSETINTKNHQRVDLNKVYGGEELSLFQEATDKPKPRVKNGRIDKIVRADSVGSSRQISVDFFSHVHRNQYSLCQSEQSYPPAGFRPFPLCIEKSLNGGQFSATNSSRQNSTQSCQWIGNIVGQKPSPGSVRSLGVCNTCHSAPRQNKESAHLWPSTIPSNMPYLYGVPQKCADKVAKLDVLSCCPGSLPKGNVNGNDDRNFLNLASNFEKHSRKFDSEVFRRTNADYPFTCKHNGMGSLDLYSNETIPAMHLLSLMDAGLQSGAPVDVDGNQKFVKRTSFPQGHHPKEFLSLPSGINRANSMKHPSVDCYGKSYLSESFCECMSATPAAGPSTSSFQYDRSLKKATDFTGQLSLKSRERGKKKCSELQRLNRNRRSQTTSSSNSGLNTTCGSIPVHSMPRLVLGNSDSMMFPIQFHAIESATKQKQEAHTTSGTLSHPKSVSGNEICCINRNPADFTVPEAGNIYMIAGEDLKFRREASSSGLVKLAGQKRQRKLTERKEHSRSRTS